MKIRTKLTQLTRLSVCISLVAASAVHAVGVFTWVGTAGDSQLENTNNWSPLTAARPNSGINDTLLWDGTVPGNLILTNGLVANFDANPGFYMHVAGGHTGSLTLIESNGAAFAGGTRIRLNGTNTLNIDSGAGAVTFGNGGTVGLPITLAGKGNAEIHTCTNNSANTVTFNTDVIYVMGGGGSHTLLLAGTGNWQVNSSLQPINSAGLGLTVAGPGTVNLLGSPTAAPGVSYIGTYGNVTVSGGTLQLQSATGIGSGNTLIMTGGNLDSSIPSLVLANNNLESWNGNFGFIGTQSLDLGFGPVTMNGNRIVTVLANTLTVDGGIAGTGFSLTKAGAGTLVLNGANTYTGGTTISNGVFVLGGSATYPSGTAAAESLTNFGTLDMNGNSPIISSLNGSGVMDTIAGGSVTLTVGDQNANGAVSGAIKNTAGSVALSKTGNGLLILGGASTYSGGTTVASGLLVVSNTTGSATGSGAVTVSSGATFGGSGAVTGPVTWQSGSFATFTQGSPLTVSGSVTLSGNSITINVPGATPLGSGNYTLMTYNNVGSSGSFAVGTPTFTGAGVSAGSSVTVTNGNGVVSLVVASPPGLSGVWTNNGNGNWSVPANWSSNPQVPQKAGQVATLGLGSVFTTVTMDIPVTNGFTSFNNTNSFAIANAGNALTFDNTNGGAALIVAAGSSNSIAPPVSLNDKLAISVFSGASLAISNVISSTSPSRTVTIASGAGTLSLFGNNTYGPSAGAVGTTMTGSGILELDNNNALGAGDLSVLNSFTLRAGTALTTANNIIISNTVTTSLNNNGNNVTLSGNISGGGALGKNGAGTLTLSGANSYNGATSISAGTVKLGSVGGIPGGGAGNGDVNMGTNTILDLNGFSPVLNALNANASSSPAIVDSLSGGAVTLTLGENGDFGTFVGNIKNTSGSLALVKDGAGNQTLAGTNTYTGGTTINAGLLRVGNGNTNANAGLGTGLVVDNGALEFNLVGTNAFTNAISGSGAVQVANINLTLVLATTNTFSGNVNNAGSAGSIWLKNAASLGTGPKQVHLDNGTAGNTQMHLDGSLGNINTPVGIDFYLSNVTGTIFNESGSNTINGNIFMPFGGGNPYIIVKNGFLTLTGTAQDGGTFNNSRSMMLGGPGNGLFSGSAIDNTVLLGGVTKVDSGTWTVSGINTTVGTLNANGGTLVLSGQWAGGTAVASTAAAR